MKFSAVVFNVVALCLTFSSAFGAEEVETNHRELIDPRCEDWCAGIARGYCRRIYPRCDPL